MNFFYGAFFIVLLFFQIKSSEAQNLNITENVLGKHIGDSFVFFRDAQKSFTFAEMLHSKDDFFEKSGAQVPNFQIYDGNIWSKITLRSELKEILYFHCNYTHLNEITFWQKFEDGSVKRTQLGILADRDKMPFGLHTYVIPLDFQAHKEIEIFICTYTNTVHLLPFSVMRADELIREKQKTDLLYGIFFGIFLITFVYNIFLFFSVRDVSYFFYACYVACLGFYAAGYKGYLAYKVFENNPLAAILSTVIFAGLSGTFAGIFSYFFLGQEKIPKKPRRILFFIIASYGSGTIISLFNGTIGIYVIQFSALVGSLLLPFVGYFSLKSGFSPARYYLAAWTVLVFFVFIFMLKEFNVFSLNFFTDNCIFIGGTIEISFLSLALADKINFIKQSIIKEISEKEKAQQETLRLTLQNEQIITSQKQVLEKEVHRRTSKLKSTVEELQQINEELKITMEKMEEQSLLIEKKNKTISESIHYAGKIQSALMPDIKELSAFFLQYFVLYFPRDIVSGDFYWFYPFKHENLLFIAAADCTGHGIPGSLMSMIGINALNQIIAEHNERDTGKILDELDRLIIKILQQNNAKEVIRDGMDIALCKIDFQEKNIQFSGAMRPFFFFKNNILFETKGDKIPIANAYGEKRYYTSHTIPFDSGDSFFIFSDGIIDQFDGEDKKKFGSAKFRKLLNENVSQFHALEKVITKEFESWRGNTNQTDDILVMGFKF